MVNVPVFFTRNRSITCLSLLFIWSITSPVLAEPMVDSSLLVVSLPVGSELHADPTGQDPEHVRFDGEVKVSGLLLAYWAHIYPDDEGLTLMNAHPQRLLRFRFYPDSGRDDLLPRVVFRGVGEASPPWRIFVYKPASEEESLGFETSFRADDPEAIRLMAAFDQLPQDFVAHQQGKALQPVSVTLTGLSVILEASHIFTFGQLQSVKPLETVSLATEQIPDFQRDTYLGQPWIDRIWNPQSTWLHDAPSGKQIMAVPAGTPTIERLAPVQDGWVRVSVPEVESGQPVSGYVRAEHVAPVN